MNVTPLRQTLPGEAVVATAPALAPDVDTAWWRRRLNLFTGRSLSDVALRAEQTHRAGRLAVLGQSVSPGVVGGLDVDTRIDTDAAEVRHHELYVGPGLAIAASGEDVTVPRPLRVRIADLPLHATIGMEARTLGEFLASAPLPVAGVLVLQPIVAELRADVDPFDPCEQDPESQALEDWQLVDGCRLAFFAWPNEWATLPAAGPRWRNRLAYTLFDREVALAPGERAPWDELGIALGLMAFGADPAESPVAPWMPLFVDRYSVVRAGGRPRARTAAVPGAGQKFTWQARIEQLAEHLADAGRTVADIAGIAAEFRYLPPVGLLPTQAVDVRTRRTTFFPSSYVVEALPIPLEQLDTAVRTAASMRPLDLTTPDRVRILVPVPQTLFEPRLLQTDAPDPSFQTALDEFLARRAEQLQRRADVRARIAALLDAIDGTAPVFPSPDPDALEEDEVVGGGVLDPEEDAYGTEGDGSVRVTAFEALLAELRGSAPWSTAEVSTPLAALPAGLTLPASLPEAFRTRMRFDAARHLLFLRGVTTTDEREQLQALPAGDAAWETAIGTLHAQANADFAELHAKGIAGFITYLESKIRRADDRVDFGFLRIQTDIYRLRHVMLGATEATRLATSPVLASIAKGETAIATREDLNTFFTAAKGVVVERPQGSGATDAEYINFVRTIGGEGRAPGIVRSMRAGATAAVRGATTTLGGAAGVSGTSTLRVTTEITGGVRLNDAIGDAGIIADRLDTQAELVQRSTAITQVAGQIATTFDITQADPIVGEGYDFRTATVAQRMESPPALEAKSFSVAGKFEVLSGLAGLDIHLSDVPVSGLGASATFGAVSSDVLGQILEGAFDPNPENGDEADFLGRGVKALDDAVVTLRAVEGRVQQYRAALEKCRQALPGLRAHAAAADRRLKQVGDALAEARHDVSIGRALLAEETGRVAAINARRAEILASHVPFLAYVRPRLVEATVTRPSRVVYPGLTEAPVPVCLSRDVAVPPDLRAIVDLMRELPVRWFTGLPRVMDRFDRLDVLHGAVIGAKARAAARPAGEAALAMPVGSVTKLGQGVFKAFSAQQQAISAVRAATAQIDLSRFAGLSWQDSRQQAEEVVSLGDLIDAGHGRTDVAQAAAREIDRIARVSACLYEAAGDVLPRVRLEWAERLSQYDEAVSLRNLASLPRWGDIGFAERREMQGLVDWLYSRVDARMPQAAALVGDIVRVAILLASHAPVSQIVAGHVPAPTVVRPGGRFDIKVDLSKVRIGMHVLLYDKDAVVARGVVQDLASGLAAAHVTETFRASVSVDAGARVQFSARELPAMLAAGPGARG